MQRQRWMAMAVFACLAPAALTQDTGEQTPTNDGLTLRQIGAHWADVEAREQLIDAELAALDREALPEDHWARQWSGTYYTGDGLGANARIRIAPESGFTYTSSGCFGMYDMNHADIVEVFDDGLRLDLAMKPNAEYHGFLDERIYFVRWGERRYIVPEGVMLRVVNGYNDGIFTREGLFTMPRWYERDVRHLQEFQGPPGGELVLPGKWAAMLLDEPLELTITAVKTLPASDVWDIVLVRHWKVEFAGGRADGVYEKMEFHLGEGVVRGTVTITEVDEDRCRGEVWWVLRRDDRKGPEVGQTVVLGADT